MEKDHREIIFVVASPLKNYCPSAKNYILLFEGFFLLPLKTPHEILPLNSHLKIAGPGEKAHRLPVDFTLISSPRSAAWTMNYHEMMLMPVHILLLHEYE